MNFYNPNDFALAPDAWEWNQLLKPDQSSRKYFFDGFPYDNHPDYHSGSPDDDPPWDHFKYENLLAFVPLPIAQNRYEIMAFAAEARSKAMGVLSVGAAFQQNVNLTDPNNGIWPPDSQDVAPRQYSRHKWHSAQFRSTNMRQQGYWQALLGLRGFNIPSSP